MKENYSFQEKVDAVLKQLRNSEEEMKGMERMRKEHQDQLAESERQSSSLANEVKGLQEKLKEVNNRLGEQVYRAERELNCRFDKERKEMKEKINKLEETTAQNKEKIYKLAIEVENKKEELKRKSA